MHFENDPNTNKWPDTQTNYHPSLPPLNKVQPLLPATFLQRWLAFGVDLAIFLAFWFTGTTLYHYFKNQLLQELRPDQDLRSIAGSQLFLILFFGLFIFVGYGIYYVYTYARGQTLGCRVAGLRFVSSTGGKPGNQASLLRYISQIIVYGLLFFFGYLGYVEPFFVRLLNGDKYYGLVAKPPIIAGVLLTGLVWALPHLSMVLQKKRQSLYDIAFQVFAVKAR